MAVVIGRRQFISTLGGAAAGWPLVVRAQQSSKKVPVVGVLWHAGSAEEEGVYLNVLLKAFSDLGYVEGKNIKLEHRFPAERSRSFPNVGARTCRKQSRTPSSRWQLSVQSELKKLTSTIPIVFVSGAGPGRHGTCRESGPAGRQCDRPLAHDTRFEWKAFGLLKEAVPNLSRVAFLVDRSDPNRERGIKAQPSCGRGARNSRCGQPK